METVPRREVMSREEKAALIPNWAALLFASGVLIAITGFLAAWLFNSAIPLMIMTAGLACSAAGMHTAERRIESAHTS